MTNSIKNEREAVEALIWRLTEWRGTANVVHECMRAVDVYATAVRNLDAGIPNAVTLSPAGTGDIVRIEPITGTDHEVLMELLDSDDLDEAAVKVCRRCSMIKPMSEFTRDRANRTDGRLNKCKACVKRQKEDTARGKRTPL